jgi:hypothetical protein
MERKMIIEGFTCPFMVLIMGIIIISNDNLFVPWSNITG